MISREQQIATRRAIIARWEAAGRPAHPEAESNRLRAICRSCPQFIPTPCKCGKCGLTELRISYGRATDTCPQGKWEQKAMSQCAYLGEAIPAKTANEGQQVHECRLHEFCTTNGKWTDVRVCRRCRDKLPLDSPDLLTKFHDPLKFYDSQRKPFTGFRDLLKGGDAFLLCGGPSAKELPLEQLNQRGCWTLAINNVAGWSRVRPQAFTCSDPPSKFCDGIWMDPTIMKLLPEPKLRPRRGRIRRRRLNPDSGACQACSGAGCDQCLFEPALRDGKPLSACDCPNTWGYSRRSWLLPDDSFFTTPDAAWGNHQVGVLKYGQEKTVCTMLLGMRLLYYLGARRIYLVGVDFFMDPTRDAQGNYSFGEMRNAGACESNNAQFAVVNRWLCKMQEDGVFKRFGVEFFNCYRYSGLRAFPFMPFEQAIMEARQLLPSEPFNLSNWYTK